ncbi:MAG: hypothetical protein R3B69_03715 [Candidatus Paceibacterota bacterium]
MTSLVDGTFAKQTSLSTVNPCPNCDTYGNPQLSGDRTVLNSKVSYKSETFDNGTQQAADKIGGWEFNGHTAPGIADQLTQVLADLWSLLKVALRLLVNLTHLHSLHQQSTSISNQ